MSNPPASPQQPPACAATRKDGSPCRAPAINGGPYCFAHSPEYAAARAKGGRNRSRAARSYKALPERLRPVADLLTGALVEVRRGTLDPRRATAMAALASALCRVVTAGEIEDRLRNVEQALADNAGA